MRLSVSEVWRIQDWSIARAELLCREPETAARLAMEVLSHVFSFCFFCDLSR